MSVREELEKLSRLQDLDLKIDRAKKLMSSAPQAFSLFWNLKSVQKKESLMPLPV